MIWRPIILLLAVIVALTAAVACNLWHEGPIGSPEQTNVPTPQAEVSP